MYVEQVAFGLPSEYLMCPPDRKGGEILLNDILRGGNFGKYDKSNIQGNKTYGANLRRM